MPDRRFSTDTFDVYDIIEGDALDTIDTIRAPAELQDSVDALHDEIELLREIQFSVRTSIEVREYSSAVEEIVEGRKRIAAVNAAARVLSLDECTSETWVGDWFDQAETLVAQEQEATAPTGDFMTDVQRACARLAADIAGAPLPVDGIDTYLYTSTLAQALSLFARDLSALVVPERYARAVRELDATLDAATASVNAVDSAALGSDNADFEVLKATAQADLASLLDTIAALGVGC